MFNFFEQPWTLLVLAILVLLVLLSLASVITYKRLWWLYAIPVFMAVAAFGLDSMVQTDSEQIKEVIKKAAAAVEEENTEEIKKLISENYSDSYHYSKQHLINDCKRRLSDPLIEKNITRILSMELRPPNATVVFFSRLMFDKQSYVYEIMQEMVIKTKLQLQKESDNQWLIRQVEIEQINLRPARWTDLG